MTPGQCVAARSLLGWSSRELAIRAGLAPTTVRNFEDPEKRHSTNQATVALLERVLREHGIRFRAADKPDEGCVAVAVRMSDGSLVELGS